MMPALDKTPNMEPRDLDPKKGRASRILLEILKSHLSFLARRGELESDIDDETMEYYRALGEKTEIPPEVTERFLRTARRAVLERCLAAVARNMPKAFYTFGHLLREIRGAAEVGVNEIADVLGKDTSYVNEIESGEVNPLNIDPVVISEMAILYTLPFSVIEKSIRVDATQRAVGESVGSGLPRVAKGSTNKRTAVETAHEDLAYYLSKDTEKVQVPSGFLEAIQVELRKKGRGDLLTKI
jgi:transcriptional regulator with XRE-family HTH domain